MAKVTTTEATNILNDMLHSLSKLLCGLTGKNCCYVRDPNDPVPTIIEHHDNMDREALKEIEAQLDKIKQMIDRAETVLESFAENDGYRIVRCSICGQKGVDTISNGVISEGLISIKGQLYCKECANILTEMLDTTVVSDI